MAELLHKQNFTTPSQQAASPHEILQEINLEDEFAPELGLLKKQMTEPREEAVDRLLQLIHIQTAAEHQSC